MKKCSKCKTFKLLTDFAANVSNKDGRDYNCLVCHREYTAQHYVNNKKYYKQKTTKRVEKLREWFREYKNNLSCEQCEEDHPACIEFHHIDPKEKDLEISSAIAHGWTQDRILQEIEKCKVLCSNCHRKHHWEEKTGSWQFRK